MGLWGSEKCMCQVSMFNTTLTNFGRSEWKRFWRRFTANGAVCFCSLWRCTDSENDRTKLKMWPKPFCRGFSVFTYWQIQSGVQKTTIFCPVSQDSIYMKYSSLLSLSFWDTFTWSLQALFRMFACRSRRHQSLNQLQPPAVGQWEGPISLGAHRSEQPALNLTHSDSGFLSPFIWSVGALWIDDRPTGQGLQETNSLELSDFILHYLGKYLC